MQTRARMDFRLFRGWAGCLVLRPWFDWIGVRAVANWYLPLSRAWAAGAAAQGSVEAFVEAVGPGGAKLRSAKATLARLDARHRAYEVAAAQWEEDFFGPADRGPDTLAVAERQRLGRSIAYMATRGAFMGVRRRVPRLAWKIAPPAAVERAHGDRLSSPSNAFPPPVPDTIIDASRTITRDGRIEGWLRMTAPVLGDTAWARIIRPAEGPVHGTVVSLHGVFMEQDSWRMADPVTDLVEQGFCVIRPEGPWHGRRCPPGAFGGEKVFAEGILGFIEVFHAWVAEVALWTSWARMHVSPRVAVAGISLGALTAQLVVSACSAWPQEMRPDAVLLITTTEDIVDGALNGSLARAIAIYEQLWTAGWTAEAIHRWRPLVEPADRPAVDPSRIVMALGDVDTVTPYAGGRALADKWGVPAENRFIGHQGHFTTALGLYRHPVPLHRLAAIMKALW